MARCETPTASSPSMWLRIALSYGSGAARRPAAWRSRLLSSTARNSADIPAWNASRCAPLSGCPGRTAAACSSPRSWSESSATLDDRSDSGESLDSEPSALLPMAKAVTPDAAASGSGYARSNLLPRRGTSRTYDAHSSSATAAATAARAASTSPVGSSAPSPVSAVGSA